MAADQKPKIGINCLFKVNTAAEGQPASYESVAGQRAANLKLNNKEVDVTSKDSAGWEENLPGINSWAMDCDGLYIDGDAAAAQLEAQFIARAQIMVEMVMPSGKKYDGLATIGSLEIAGPHDKEMTSKISVKGSGALTPTPAA